MGGANALPPVRVPLDQQPTHAPRKGLSNQDCAYLEVQHKIACNLWFDPAALPCNNAGTAIMTLQNFMERADEIFKIAIEAIKKTASTRIIL